ncbi:MAG: nickel pincer cofactor biosynthesis protein LarC [Acidobacteriota bacterium]
MRVLVFDPFNGIAGDMTVGALLHLGVPLEYLQGELAKLDLGRYRLVAAETKRRGVRCVDFRVETQDGAGVPHRTYARIRELIERADIDARARRWAQQVFHRLAAAEAKVHGAALEEVHFHEVGAIDSVVDIVGACLGFSYLGVERFFTREIHLGGGDVTFSHGTWRVPAPATAELVQGLPVRLGQGEGELTTPTGAAIIAALVEAGDPPELHVERVGYGAGDREIPGIPNVLRLILGTSGETKPSGAEKPTDEVVVLETAVDDVDGQVLGRCVGLLLEAGALDVYLTPVMMKKNRPGHLVTVLCREDTEETLADLLFRETTTLGIRRRSERRWILEREAVTVDSEWGRVRCKVVRRDGAILRVTPEYEDLARIAGESGLSLLDLRQAVISKVRESERWESNST